MVRLVLFYCVGGFLFVGFFVLFSVGLVWVWFVCLFLMKIWMEKLRWLKFNSALGIALNAGKIKSQKVFLSSCWFLSSEWVASRSCWSWFLALRHLTLLVAWQEAQTVAGKIISGKGQKQRPGSQWRRSLCGTERMGLWKKIALGAIYRNRVGFFSLMLFKIKTFSSIEHASDSSHVCCLCRTYK